MPPTVTTTPLTVIWSPAATLGLVLNAIAVSSRCVVVAPAARPSVANAVPPSVNVPMSPAAVPNTTSRDTAPPHRATAAPTFATPADRIAVDTDIRSPCAPSGFSNTVVATGAATPPPANVTEGAAP